MIDILFRRILGEYISNSKICIFNVAIPTFAKLKPIRIKFPLDCVECMNAHDQLN